MIKMDRTPKVSCNDYVGNHGDSESNSEVAGGFDGFWPEAAASVACTVPVIARRSDALSYADGRSSSAASRQAISVGVANGLVRKQVAPAFSARARTLSSGKAVMTMKGAA